jgi:RNA polymerase sigma-70 factor (ECF subfamily)
LLAVSILQKDLLLLLLLTFSKRMTGATDKELCEALRKSGESRELAFAELYRRYASRIYQYARRILNRDMEAEDILQETFIKFLNILEKETVIENVPAYLLRIARNLSLRSGSKRQVTVPIEDYHAIFEEAPMEAEETSKILQMSLELLPKDQREALVLQVYGGLSYLEIADVMGVPMTTVRNWIVRAKDKMRKIVAPYFQERGETQEL